MGPSLIPQRYPASTISLTSCMYWAPLVTSRIMLKGSSMLQTPFASSGAHPTARRVFAISALSPYSLIFPCLHVLQAKKSGNVSSAKMSDDLPLWSHVDGHLLDPSLSAGVDQIDCLAVGNCAREKSASCNNAGLGVHNDVGDRHQNGALVVAFDHRLAILAVRVSMPDLRYPVDLCFVRRGHDFDRHSQDGLVDRRSVLELLHFPV